ncbi:hypothetical protein HCU77_39040 [Streptomyces coelicolor]|nr:hypothetical protein [Streptomyces coelicolor]QKN70944.1 hypothetical protein HCU77_39040 [Streptomyces coelicolor]
MQGHRPPPARRADHPARHAGAAPGPRPEEGRQAGWEVVPIDGTLIPTQRCTGKADRRTTPANTAVTACTSSP